MSTEMPIKAVVQKVIPEGEHGPFVVATSDQLTGSVTFSLEPSIWKEADWPEEGMYVILEKLRQKRAGWRAKAGRFFKPSDEQTETRKEQQMSKNTVDTVATVVRVETKGTPYALALSPQRSIKVSLEPSVWKEKRHPNVSDEIFGETLYRPSEDSTGFDYVKAARFAKPTDKREVACIDENLAKRISFAENQVYLNGKSIFTIPVPEQRVTTLGFWPVKHCHIDVGTSFCCHGFLFCLRHSEKEGYVIYNIISVDLNVYDMMRCYADYQKLPSGNGESVLVTGYGCAGSGVRLLTTAYPGVYEVVSDEQMRAMVPGGEHYKPVFRVDLKTRRPCLDVRRAGYRVKPGMTRTPGLPSILVDKNEEFVVEEDLWGSIDLTDKLHALGVQVDQTICMSMEYRRQLAK